MSSFDYGDDNDFYDDDEVQLQLVPCGNCGRNFSEDALPRHQKVCTSLKKRKPFDSSKQRLQGVEKAKVTAAVAATSKKQPKKKDWRRQHEEFIRNIRAARGINHAIKTGGELPPPPEPTENPDYVQCEFCNRRFNESAAERHINFCKEQKTRLPKGSSDSKYDQKKQKQQIRTKYRPPLPGQKKKSASDDSSPTRIRSSGSTKNTPKQDASPKKKIGSRNSGIPKHEDDERPIPTNSRYSRTSSSEPEQQRTPKSGKNKSDPQWFEDLQKRTNSGKQSRQHLDDIDSGLDLNDNYNNNSNSRSSSNSGRSRNRAQQQHPVGVVRPSSRTKDKGGIFDDESPAERSPVSAGRRQKMANFCHDCGTKYPVANAKFCCECGLKRVVLA